MAIRRKLYPGLLCKLVGFPNGSFKSLRSSVGSLDSRVGIVAKLSDCIASRGGKILVADVFVPKTGNVFYSRSEFIFDPVKWPRSQMDEDFLTISNRFNAMRSVIRVPLLDPKYKIVILASRQEHCLVDLLHGWQVGQLPVEVSCVISNHDRGPNTHVMRFLEKRGIPYHYLHTTRDNKREDEILDLVEDTDFLVLARYMRILSGSFFRSYGKETIKKKRSYGKDVINIHHGLLPSFRGRNPSKLVTFLLLKTAFNSGVKLIGETAHFITEELDAGPIIEQMGERFSHRDSLQSFVQKLESLEKQCLWKAIKSYCELGVLPYKTNKTVVF